MADIINQQPETTIVYMPSSPDQIIVANLADPATQNWRYTDNVVVEANEESEQVEQTEEVEEDDEDESDRVVRVGGLTPITDCCTKKKCYIKFQQMVQEDCFNRFWSIKTKSNQNYFLAGLMSSEEPKRMVSKPVRHNKSHSWHYFVDVRGKKVQVCQNFFRGVYGISNSKIQTIQNKLVLGASLDDLRGRFSKKKKSKIINDVNDALKKTNKKTKN